VPRVIEIYLENAKIAVKDFDCVSVAARYFDIARIAAKDLDSVKGCCIGFG
jgi:hypothetical protein